MVGTHASGSVWTSPLGRFILSLYQISQLNFPRADFHTLLWRSSIITTLYRREMLVKWTRSLDISRFSNSFPCCQYSDLVGKVPYGLWMTLVSSCLFFFLILSVAFAGTLFVGDLPMPSWHTLTSVLLYRGVTVILSSAMVAIVSFHG